MLFVSFWFAGFLLFVFDSAPVALSQFPPPLLCDDLRPLAIMGFLQGNVVDARMVMLGVVAGKGPLELGENPAVGQEAGMGYSGAHLTVVKRTQ